MIPRNYLSKMLIAVMSLGGAVYLAACAASHNADTGAPPDFDPAPAANAAQDPSAVALEWPRVFQEGGWTLSVYQPQIDRWDGLQLESRAAVAVKAGDAPEVYGIIEITGTTDVDKVARTVTLRNLRITKASFPTAPDRELAYLVALRNHLPVVRVLSLDHFEASYAMSQTANVVRTADVSNNVPRILYSDKPALLVLVDGIPVLKPVPNSPAMYVQNTPAPILKLNDKFYLSAIDRWYEATDIEGPWTLSTAAPLAILTQAKANLPSTAQQLGAQASPQTQPAASPTQPPAVLVSTVPAELIQTKGQPGFETIEGTHLLSVKNSDNAIFLDTGSNDFYVLISGRWFKGVSLERGPWSYVAAAAQLPGDFAKIPPDNARANVLVSVPGTPQAQEAVIATSIPQTAAVDRAQTKAEVTYDGPPRFVSIPQTPTVEYATNTRTPVFHIVGDGYYCVQNGVWFTAASSVGPWAVAVNVPPIIYTIPPSCPVYYATYCRVYDSTPETVYVGYTPGYLGAYVSPEYTVVYGTGYDYTPYVGDIWVGYPWTYGYGAGFAYGYDTGFEFGFSAGLDFGFWYEPWWGPLGWGWNHGHHYHHHHLNHVSIYDHWAGHGVTSRAGHYDARTATSAHGREAFNPYSGVRRTSPGAAALHGRIGSSSWVEPRSNIYAGHDGQVYRQTGSEWQRSTRQGWSSVERDNSFQSQRGRLDIERQSRSVGQQRYESYHSAPAPSHFGGGGGGGGHHR